MPGFQRVAAQRARLETSVNRGAKSSRSTPRAADRRAAVAAQHEAARDSRLRRSTRPAFRKAAATCAAAFDQHARQAALAERLRGRRDIDPALRVGRDFDDLDAALLQASRAVAGAAGVQSTQIGVVPRRRASFDAATGAPCESSTIRTGE